MLVFGCVGIIIKGGVIGGQVERTVEKEFDVGSFSYFITMSSQ